MAAVAVLPMMDMRGMPSPLDVYARIHRCTEAFLDKRARKSVVDKSSLQSNRSQSRYFRKPVKDDFEVDWSNILGSGYSGSVVVAKQRATGQECALKSYNKQLMSRDKLRMLKSEIEISLSISHPHVARLLYVYEDSDTVNLLMELCTGRDLFQRLNQAGTFHESAARDLTHQMLLAVEFIHRQGIVHRDIKLENWLFDGVSEDATLKLTDFGFSTRWDGRKELHGSPGSTHYMAPEVFFGHYTDKCDMWSLGVVVYLLLSGKLPFHGDTDAQTIRQIMICEYQFPSGGPEISSLARDFIERLLVVNPAKRMTATECLKHPWIHQACEESGETGSSPEALPVLLRGAMRTRSAVPNERSEMLVRNMMFAKP